MNKIKKLRVAGLRRLYDLEIEMRPLMVLVGANGVGKTSFLDAVSLLSNSAKGRLNSALSELGGLADLSTRGREKK